MIREVGDGNSSENVRLLRDSREENFNDGIFVFNFNSSKLRYTCRTFEMILDC
jgi:hypothetical protein